MIHYIILMGERKFMPGNFLSQYFYKKGEGNEVPEFKKSLSDFSTSRSLLIVDGFNECESLSIQEVILNDVAEITIFFFDVAGNFNRTGIYRRMA